MSYSVSYRNCALIVGKKHQAPVFSSMCAAGAKARLIDEKSSIHLIDVCYRLRLAKSMPTAYVQPQHGSDPNPGGGSFLLEYTNACFCMRHCHQTSIKCRGKNSIAEQKALQGYRRDHYGRCPWSDDGLGCHLSVLSKAFGWNGISTQSPTRTPTEHRHVVPSKKRKSGSKLKLSASSIPTFFPTAKAKALKGHPLKVPSKFEKSLTQSLITFTSKCQRNCAIIVGKMHARAVFSTLCTDRAIPAGFLSSKIYAIDVCAAVTKERGVV